MLFRQQTRHATAPNRTMSMTYVFYFRKAIKTTTLVVLWEYWHLSKVKGCAVPEPFYQNFSSLVSPPKDELNSIRLALLYDDLLEFRFKLSPCQSTKRYTDGSDRCASTIVNISSVQFAMYPFSKCCFALLMRTRSPTLNLGVPTLSWPYNRCHTVSGLVLVTSDTAVTGVVVRSHKGLQDLDVSNRLFLVWYNATCKVFYYYILWTITHSTYQIGFGVF